MQKGMSDTAYLRVCVHCDLVQEIPSLKEGQRVVCGRCKTVLAKHTRNSLNRSLALAITGIVLFLITNMFPILTLKAQGVMVDSSLLAASIELYKIDRPFLSILVFFTTLVFPLLSLMGIIYVLGSIRFGWNARHMAPIYRFLDNSEIWGMLEVFLLAVIVAGVKLGDLAEVIIGPSLYSFFALIIIMAMLGMTLNPEDVWKHRRAQYE